MSIQLLAEQRDGQKLGCAEARAHTHTHTMVTCYNEDFIWVSKYIICTHTHVGAYACMSKLQTYADSRRAVSPAKISLPFSISLGFMYRWAPLYNSGRSGGGAVLENLNLKYTRVRWTQLKQLCYQLATCPQGFSAVLLMWAGRERF